jgi:hypothetical protein
MKKNFSADSVLSPNLPIAKISQQIMSRWQRTGPCHENASRANSIVYPNGNLWPVRKGKTQFSKAPLEQIQPTAIRTSDVDHAGSQLQ